MAINSKSGESDEPRSTSSLSASLAGLASSKVGSAALGMAGKAALKGVQAAVSSQPVSRVAVKVVVGALSGAVDGMASEVGHGTMAGKVLGAGTSLARNVVGLSPAALVEPMVPRRQRKWWIVFGVVIGVTVMAVARMVT